MKPAPYSNITLLVASLVLSGSVIAEPVEPTWGSLAAKETSRGVGGRI